MGACIAAAAAHRRLDDTTAAVDRLRRLVELLADTIDVDLDNLELVERVARRGGVAVTWEEQVAVGLSPGDAA